MGTQYIPNLSVEAARYSPHDYLVRFTALTGWTLAVARRYENGYFVATTPDEQETCLLISEEEALELTRTWNFALTAEAEERAVEAERLAVEQDDFLEHSYEVETRAAEVDFGMEFPPKS